MKKSSILLIVLLAFFGCKKNSDKVALEGNIEGLTYDTLYLYGIDDIFDEVDTIVAKNGKFTHTAKVDTSCIALLYINKQREYPIFLDKGTQITIEGNAANLSSLEVKGNVTNEELTNFQQSIQGIKPEAKESVRKKAKEFISTHPSSFVSLYLIEQYFVREKSVKAEETRKLLESLAGNLQDNSYYERINEYVTAESTDQDGRFLPYFSLPNPKGEKISRTSSAFSNKYLLINFWASWDGRADNQKKLRQLYREFKGNKNFAMLGISLDVDKQAWKEAIKRDSLGWEQVYDRTGLNSELAKQSGINDLPMNLLLNSEGKIVARNIPADSLSSKIKSFIGALTTQKTDKSKK